MDIISKMQNIKFAKNYYMNINYIHILHERIKIFHEKMLNAMHLYWFHNDTLVENNSLNVHSKET